MQSTIDPEKLAASLNVEIPGVVFGHGQGLYWRQHQLTSTMRKTVADQYCICAPEEVTEHMLRDTIWMGICADLRQFAFEFPHSRTAELVRQDLYIEALAELMQKQVQPAAPIVQAATVVQPSNPSVARIVEVALKILTESAAHIRNDALFKTSAAHALLLLLYKKAGRTFLNPLESDITSIYFDALIERKLILKPYWMSKDEKNIYRLFNGWDDLERPHQERIIRIKYVSDVHRAPISLYGMMTTGETYFTDLLIKYKVQYDVLSWGLTEMEALSSNISDYPKELLVNTDILTRDDVIRKTV